MEMSVGITELAVMMTVMVSACLQSLLMLAGEVEEIVILFLGNSYCIYDHLEYFQSLDS